ncbi:uncharacterized protein LOC129893176 [Solanum dulcamara]|uniref:uncharacterized protein LOC129893176 n=1 Tax=Solanum dulcamara TaxID=45834 RepID=UPI002486410C|nr:uncharacterized protein LOC129893176 [Solanum dulcamara]
MLPQLPKAPWKNLNLHRMIHPRFKFNLWLAVQHRLATVERLQKIGIQVPMNCIFCNQEEDYFDHLFFNCHYSKQVWSRSLKWLGIHISIGSWQQELNWMCKVAKKKNAHAERLDVLLAVQHRLTTVERLQRIGIQVPMNCIFCNQEEDYFDHLFFNCHYSKQVWSRSLKWLGIHISIGSWQQELNWMCKVAKKKNAHAERLDVLLAVQHRLATVERLQKIGIQVPMNCIFCNQEEEYFDHLFFNCPYSKQVWSRSLKWLGIHRSIGSWKQELDWMCKVAKKKNAHAEITCCTFATVVYNIWRDRNTLRLRKGQVTVTRTCKDIAMHLHIQGRNTAAWQTVLNMLNPFP